MELRHLYSFIAVAETGSFRAAAKRRRVAQPALGRQMSQLEADVGSLLLERVARQAPRLTPIGRIFLQEARAIVARSEKAIANIRQAAGVSSAPAKLKIGFLGAGHLPRIHQALLDTGLASPHIELDFFQGTGSEQLASLRAGRLQAACMDHFTLEGGPIDLSGMAMRPLYRVPFVAVLPRTHPLAKNKKIVLTELASQPLVVCKRDQRPGLHDYIMSQCRTALGTNPQVVQEVSGALPAVVGAVATGVSGSAAVSLLPETMCWMQVPEVVYRPLQTPGPCLEVRLVWRGGDLALGLPRARLRQQLKRKQNDYPSTGASSEI